MKLPTNDTIWSDRNVFQLEEYNQKKMIEIRIAHLLESIATASKMTGHKLKSNYKKNTS